VRYKEVEIVLEVMDVLTFRSVAVIVAFMQW